MKSPNKISISTAEQATFNERALNRANGLKLGSALLLSILFVLWGGAGALLYVQLAGLAETSWIVTSLVAAVLAISGGVFLWADLTIKTPQRAEILAHGRKAQKAEIQRSEQRSSQYSWEEREKIIDRASTLRLALYLSPVWGGIFLTAGGKIIYQMLSAGASSPLVENIVSLVIVGAVIIGCVQFFLNARLPSQRHTLTLAKIFENEARTREKYYFNSLPE